MTDKTDPVTEGRAAQSALDYVRAVVQELENETMQKWASTPARNAEERESLYQFVQALRKVPDVLRSRVTTGRKAEKEIVEAERQRGRPRMSRM